MGRLAGVALGALILGAGCPLQAAPDVPPIQRIAFGSCNRENLPQPLWEPILAFRPDVWIWLGDNIYGDTTDMAVLAAKWRAQKENPGYAKLRAAVRVLGIWDDHDYGANDAGREYPRKVESQRLLLDFLDEPAASPRRERAGIYDVVTFGPPGRQVAVILLDGRFHREAPGPDADLLGPDQWRWLERTLAASRAQVHVIASGSQILPAEHRHEKWADYPRARARLLDLLRRERTPGVVLLSGDRHFGEISRWQKDGLDLLEVTASGLTHFSTNFSGEPNAVRVAGPFVGLHFGTLEIDWAARQLTGALRDGEGRVVAAQTVSIAPAP